MLMIGVHGGVVVVIVVLVVLGTTVYQRRQLGRKALVLPCRLGLNLLRKPMNLRAQKPDPRSPLALAPASPASTCWAQRNTKREEPETLSL